MTLSKKGFIIGLIVGAILNIITLIGILACNWNPIEGSVIPSGICRSTMLPFMPFIIFSTLIMILFSRISENMLFLTIGAIIAAIISTLIIGYAGMLIGWIIGKIRGKR